MSPSAGGNELENGNVERAAAEIVDGHAAALLFVQAVGQCRGGWLVHEAQDFEAGEFAGVLRGLALRVVEIRGHGDDGAVHRIAENSSRPSFSVRAE